MIMYYGKCSPAYKWKWEQKWYFSYNSMLTCWTENVLVFATDFLWEADTHGGENIIHLNTQFSTKMVLKEFFFQLLVLEVGPF